MFTIDALHRTIHSVALELPGRGYVPARPLRFGSRLNRIGDAWAVLTGQADAVVWPEDEATP